LLSFVFYFFAACTLIGALLVALCPKLVHSAFSLVLTLFGIAGLYFTLGADFLGIVQIVVYVGGITILFLYGVMLTPRDSTRWSILGLLLPGALCAVPIGVMLHLAWKGLEEVGDFGQVPALSPPTTQRVGELFLLRDKYLIPFELASIVLLVALVGSVYLARRRRES